MPSAAAVATEILRQKATGDSRFLNVYTFFFELEVPADQVPNSPSNRFLYPLVVPPSSYSLDEPFAAEDTVGQEGSLYVEENGIVRRSIRISGNTGWAPRSTNGASVAGPLAARTPAKRSFSRKLKTVLKPDVFGDVKLSGHAHFCYLQDSVFRIYGDLKKDPATAENTKLYFHNPKDDEHWLVVPKKFSVARTASQRTLYPYDIELLILDKATSDSFASEDATMKRLFDVLALCQSAVDMIEGAIQDLRTMINAVSSFIKGIAGFITRLQQLVGAVTDFIEGVTDLIRAPYAILKAVTDFIDEAMGVIAAREELNAEVKAFPDTVRQLMLQIGDACDMLGLHPQAFVQPADRQLREALNRASLAETVGTAALTDVSKQTGPATFDELEKWGTGPLPGDAARSRAQAGMALGEVPPAYASAFEIAIEQNDTLSSLAVKYLGDARRWRNIAVLNGLKPPFVNDQAASGVDPENAALSGVLGVGRKILIPSTAKPPQQQTTAAVLGARLEQPAAEQLLGVDWALEPVPGSSSSRPLYDIPIDKERGGTDAKKVRGLANLNQAIGVRLRTERRTDLLYPDLGTDRIVGSAGSLERRAMAEFRVIEAVERDPRVASVRNLEANPLAPITDLLEVEAEAEVRGFAQGQGIRAIV